MKIVGLELKKITVGRFFPKENKVELSVVFNDGTEKEIFKIADTSDPKKVAEEILLDLRKLEKSIHKNSIQEYAVDDFVNIVVKEEDRLLNEIPQFIQKVKSHLEKIKGKNIAEGYLDMIRELKSLKIEF